MIALVTGASGFVGTHLVQRLTRDQHTVYALVRSSSQAEHLKQAGARCVLGDVRDRASLDQLVREHPDIDAVFHLASVLTPVSQGDSIYWESNYQGTLNLLEACRALTLNAFVQCSSVGVIGPLPYLPADENTRCAPDSAYGESKYQAELLALDYYQKFQVPVVVVRPAWVYGPGDRRTFKFFRMAAKGRFFLIGDGQTKLHPVYVEDVVQGLLLCAQQTAQAVGGVFILAGPTSVTLEFLSNTIAHVAGTSVLPFKIPVKLAQLGATFCEALCKPLHIEPPIHHRRLDFFVRDQAFDISQSQRLLGFEPQVDVRTGVTQTVNWYREQGWL